MKADSDGHARGNGIQVIERAAKILRALKQDQNGMSLGQIADAVDLPRSTVQRIVGSLQAERLVVAGPNGRHIRLGPEINALADATRYNVVDSCRQLLLELSQATGETADLSVLRGDSMMFLDQIPGSHRLRAVSHIGDTFPLTCTANGRACLARLPVAKAKQLIVDECRRVSGTVDPETVLAQLEQVRREGIAYDIDEHTVGISAAGIAFRDWVGEWHAISVPVPSSRFEAVRDRVVTALRHTEEQAQAVMTGA